MEDQNKHYITIFMMAECVPPPSFLGMSMHPKPMNLEPNKCEGWDSYSWDTLCSYGENAGNEELHCPIKLFGPLFQLVKDSPQIVVDFVNKV